MHKSLAEACNGEDLQKMSTELGTYRHPQLNEKARGLKNHMSIPVPDPPTGMSLEKVNSILKRQHTAIPTLHHSLQYRSIPGMQSRDGLG